MYYLLAFLLIGTVIARQPPMRFPAMCKAPGYNKFGFQPPCDGKEEEVDGVCCSIPCPAPPYQGFGTKSSDGKCKYDFEEIVENEHLGSVCCEVEPKCPEEKGYGPHGRYTYGKNECNSYSVLQDNGICCYPRCPEPRYYKYSASDMGATEEECAGYYHSEMVTHAGSGTTMCCTISTECPTDKYLRLGELPNPDGTCQASFMELVEGVCCFPLPPTPEVIIEPPGPPPTPNLPPGVIVGGGAPAAPAGGPPPGVIVEPMWKGPPTKAPKLPPGVIVGGGSSRKKRAGGRAPPGAIVEPMWEGPPTEAPKLPPGVIVGGGPPILRSPYRVSPPGGPAPSVGGPKPPRKIVEPMWKGPPTKAPKLPPGVIVGGGPPKPPAPEVIVEPMWKGPPTKAPKLPPGVIVGGGPPMKKKSAPPEEVV
jgi:hypothetical protein